MRRKLAPGGQLLPEVHHGEGLVRQRQAGLQEPQRRPGLAHHAEEGGLRAEGAADHERDGKEEEEEVWGGVTYQIRWNFDIFPQRLLGRHMGVERDTLIKL